MICRECQRDVDKAYIGFLGQEPICEPCRDLQNPSLFRRNPNFRREAEDSLGDEQVMYLKLVRVDEEVVPLLNMGGLTNITSLAFAAMLEALAHEMRAQPFAGIVVGADPQDLDLVQARVLRDEYDWHVTQDDDHTYRAYLRSKQFNPDLPVGVEFDEEDTRYVVLSQLKEKDA